MGNFNLSIERDINIMIMSETFMLLHLSLKQKRKNVERRFPNKTESMRMRASLKQKREKCETPFPEIR